MFTLIKHALQMRRTQSIATFLSVALSVAVVFALTLTFIGVKSGLETSSQRLGADLVVIPADAAGSVDEEALLFTGAPANMYMDADLETRVQAIGGVQSATAQFFGQTLDADCCTAQGPARLIGYEPESDWVVEPWLSGAGSGDRSNAWIIAGSDLVSDFENGGAILGHNVEMAGALEPTGTDMDESVLMDIDQVRDFVRDTEDLQYLWDEYGDPSELISCVLVKLEPGAHDQVIEELNKIDGIAVVEASTTVSKVSDQLGAVFAIMAGAAALLVLATLFQLFARFFSLAWDRRSELALYRALGASKREVGRLIVGEAGVLVGGGAVVGLVLGAVLYAAVPGLLAGVGTFPYIAPGLGVCVLAALCVALLFALIGLLAVAWPLSRAGRIDPSSAMQTGDID